MISTVSHSTRISGPTSPSIYRTSEWQSSVPAPPASRSSVRSQPTSVRFTCSNVVRIGAPLCTTGRSPTPRWMTSARGTTRSSSDAQRPLEGSSTAPIPAHITMWHRGTGTPSGRSCTPSRDWLANFREVLMEEEANAEFSAFVADKIRQRVNDPTIAEKLIPTDHGFGVQRVPLETNYYEAYNHEHVHLVDISEAPIERIVPEGIRTSDATYEFDVIIYATGFDAITGAFDRMDIRGRDGVALRDVWDTGPRTYLGVQVVGFPNLIMLAGPQGASVSTNFPRAIETSVEWASDLISHMRSNGYHRIECTDESQDAWVREVEDLYGMVLLRNARSWFTGYNSNVDGHDIKRHMIYNGGAPRYRKRVATVAANGYDGFVLS